MSENIIEKIRDSVDLMELIKEYVPAVKKSGRTYKACCPFHQEKTPSFSISPDKGLFYCFGCQAGGDVFAFLMRIENLSFNEAARKLAQRAGIEWQQQENMTEEEKGRLNLYKVMDFAKDFYHKQLLSAAGAEAREYVKKRHLTKETVQKFELGYSAFDGLVKKALAAQHSHDDLKKLGLASYNTGTDYFKNRLMFPILNHRGETVAFGGRIMGDGQPKYLNSPETPLFSKSRILYALNFAGPAIRKEGRVILLEGYMDVIACHQAGIENCVAPLGTSFTPEHARLLKRYTSDAALIFDPDSAGINAALRAALILIENGLYVRVITLPEGLDPDDFVNKYGAEALHKQIENAPDIINFQMNILLKGRETLGPQDKTNIAAELVETIKKQPDEIIKREWARITADRLNIDAEVILSKIITRPARVNQPPQKPQEAAPVETTPKAEEDLIKLLLKFPRYTELCKDLEEGDFKNSKMWYILKGVQILREQAPNIENAAAALTKELPQHANEILKLSLEPLPQSLKASKDIEDTVKTIKKAAYSERLKKIEQEVKQYPTGGVPAELQKQQIELIKKIKSH